MKIVAPNSLLGTPTLYKHKPRTFTSYTVVSFLPNYGGQSWEHRHMIFVRVTFVTVFLSWKTFVRENIYPGRHLSGWHLSGLYLLRWEGQIGTSIAVQERKKNICVNPFTNPAAHSGLRSRCSIAGDEWVILAPIGWYCCVIWISKDYVSAKQDWWHELLSTHWLVLIIVSLLHIFLQWLPEFHNRKKT